MTIRYLIPAFAITFLIGGCDSEIGPDTAPDKPLHSVVSLTSVVADQCRDICRRITVTISVNNNRSTPLCIPSVYKSTSINGAFYFKYDDMSESITTSEPYDPNIFLSRNYMDDMRSLSSMPQYVVPSGRMEDIRVVMEDKFDVIRKPVTAVIRLATFACDLQGNNLTSMAVRDLEQRVTFSG